MKAFVVLLLVVVVGIAQASVSDNDVDIALWESFKAEYNKSYLTRSEEEFRMKAFLENNRKVAEHNARFEQGLVSYELGLNEYSDMPHSDFVRMMNGFNMSRPLEPSNRQQFVVPADLKYTIPATMDWRQYGAVTPIKNQGYCGSCWAFASIGALESHHFRRTNQLVRLSEQNLIDCTYGRYGNYGCNGGWMNPAYQYARDNGGVATEYGYPYEMRDNSCRYNAAHRGAVCYGYVDIPKYNEEQLKAAVATRGPVAVAIDASHQTFALYRGGVYQEPYCSTTYLDHAVLVIGYGTENGRDYWLVKNSWGQSWGENGYVKMARNMNNHCGVYESRNCSTTYLNHAVLVVGYGTQNRKDYWLVKNSWGEGWGENGYIKMARNKNNHCGIASVASYPLVK